MIVLATPYEKIYERFLPKLQDFDIPTLKLNVAENIMFDYLNIAISRFGLCRQDLSDRNDDFQQFNIDLTDKEIDILSNYMVIEYIDANYIRTPTLLKVSLSSSDFHAFSNANHLDKLTNMHQLFVKDNDKLLMEYSWYVECRNRKIKYGLGNGYKPRTSENT